jgi:hypothetical protein
MQFTERVTGLLAAWTIFTTGSSFLALAATGAHAQSRNGDWSVERYRDATVALTQNEAGSTLGYACGQGNQTCVFFFMPDKLKCNEGARYALLFNGGHESTGRSTVCTRLEWRDGYSFANVLDATDALRKQMLNADGASLGIARGTGTDTFAISRFGMRGFRGAFEEVNRRRDGQGGGPLGGPLGATGVEFELFEHVEFQGRRLDGRGDIANLVDWRFNDIVSSIVIHRGHWQFCSDANFRGRCETYRPGRYAHVGVFNDTFSSVRRVN